jgi:CHAT domain-containing protein/Tfp pilus assembly protein PilF
MLFLLLNGAFLIFGQTRKEKQSAAKRIYKEAEKLATGNTADSLRTAIEKFQTARRLFHESNDKKGEADSLLGIGIVAFSLSDRDMALAAFNDSLPLFHVIKDKNSEADILNNIGLIYSKSRDINKAFKYLNNALPVYRTTRNLGGQAATLNNLGEVYFYTGEIPKAFDYFKQSLPLYRAVKDKGGQAIVLNNFGVLFSQIGDQQKALEYFNQSLKLRRSAQDVNGEAATLTNIGTTNSKLKNHQKALESLTKSLQLYHQLEDANGEANAAVSLSGVYLDLKDHQTALEHYERALKLYQKVKDKVGEATTFNNIGLMYAQSGDNARALEYLNQSLPPFRAVNDRNGEAATLLNQSSVYQRLGNNRLAVIFGKLSVNAYQQMRANLVNLDKNLQQSYLRSIEKSYRHLADVLIKSARLAEAQQVLNLFKDQQYFDFGSTKQAPPLTLSEREAAFSSAFQQKLENFAVAIRLLDDIKLTIVNRGGEPTETQTAQIKQTEIEIQKKQGDYQAFLNQAEKLFSQPSSGTDNILATKDLVVLQDTLRELASQTGQKAVAVYQLVAEENFHEIVITPDSISSITPNVKSGILQEQALQLSALLQSPVYDPAKLSEELYEIIIKPIEERFPPDTQTIMWSLDGNLRYLPMAALYDGKQYLVARYNHVLFTRADKERLVRPVNPNWKGYGFASAQPRTVNFLGSLINFAGLDYVNKEMEIFRTKTFPAGIIDGNVFPDTKFTKASLISALRKRRPLVHISSHFRFYPGDESLSFLLLGNGKTMTLLEMKKQEKLFQDVELLTLSACETAAQLPDSTGREIDAFAELAQRLGANSVIASLWAVLDNSTAQLMKEFYKNRQGRKVTKAQALQKAQLDLLSGKTEILPDSRIKGSKRIRRRDSTSEDLIVAEKYRIPFHPDQKKPYAHPYYWAPFVLFGNWK